MFAECLLAAAFQVGPFWEQRLDFAAARPFYSCEDEETDVLWPLFTSHRDWWRFCFVAHRQSYENDGYQFDLIPFWFSGRTREGEDYWGLFPFYGRHPHIALVYDLKFAMWPLWMRYRMPRGREWLETNSVLFPFFSRRSDGAWSFWPLYGVNHQRESDHRYALWPLVTWASYRADRDTAGAGYSWMVWPLYGKVSRERESQTMFLPPFFSFAEVYTNGQGRGGAMRSCPFFRLRCPWPFFEYEDMPQRSRLSVWPLYESVENYDYLKGVRTSGVKRFGWKLVEIYDDETRVFPFWVGRKDDSYVRLWPLWESHREGGEVKSRFLSLFPVRWVPAVNRNWSKFWTLYERVSDGRETENSAFWGLIRWRTGND